MNEPAIINIDYISSRLTGRLILGSNGQNSSFWERLLTRFISEDNTSISGDYIETTWPNILDIIREFGDKSSQQSFNFRFQPLDSAKEKVREFVLQIRESRLFKDSLIATLSNEEIIYNLVLLGFKRKLRPFQIRDIQHLTALSHGANFSVPGAGKTTVTFAVHLLTKKDKQHLLVICPKSAFPAWKDIVDECMKDNAPYNGSEKFTVLDGRENETNLLLNSGATRFVMSYDLLVRQQTIISSYLSRQSVHLVLDESHRMKAGFSSQRGAYLINISSLPSRRDILSGTPMPQGASDMASQLRFLWPGIGLDLQIQRGISPREVLGNRYVRTTKSELGLPPAKRHFYDVSMSEGQLALYSVVRNEALRQLANAVNYRGLSPDYLSARKSIMRLLQLSVNPTLALQGILKDNPNIDSGIVDKVVEEGISTKMQKVSSHARNLAKVNKKVVIWTIFTGTIFDLETQLADLNPVTLYGGVPSGNNDDGNSREGRIFRFHNDSSCMVMIANPAAAGEGISLHTVCHDAIYLDRSYVSTHYLQSIDRIHRLGLPPKTETNIHIYRTKAPAMIGSIDLSVSRRLTTKIHKLEQLLDDPDLRLLALDEENADDPIDYDVDMQDLVDLISELEGSAKSPNGEEL